ncbi:hypothetical protein BS78_08G100700 [Paspalum vaginatum]|nr:hypothetical protein BS78_08G100700 [Paspalum vaginatum]
MNGLGNEVFTRKVIRATDGEPLKICMVGNGPDGTAPHRLLSAKIKIVVLDGDFNRHNQEGWVSEEFRSYIVRPRDKVGAVLAGVSELSLKNGEAYLHGATFSDNSKFVRSGQFRLGAMVDEEELGERVQEGITEPFIVKDRRSEGNQKHNIPLLNDDVWRLKKISNGGVLHVALRDHNIFNVKDLLRLYHKDEQALRKILIKASELVWTTIVEHAKKCDPGKELYSFFVEASNVTLFFNSVCQIVGASFNDNYMPFSDLDKSGKDLVGQWSKDAYKNMTYGQPDFEMENGKPRPINLGVFQGFSMQGLSGEENRNVCQTDDQQGNSGNNSKQCKLKRLGSVRVTQNNEDAPLDFAVFLDPSSDEQYCAMTSADDMAGSLTFPCPATTANGITGASLTMDREEYDIPIIDNGLADAAVPQLREEQPPEQAHFATSPYTVRFLADRPIFSRPSSFNYSNNYHETPAMGAEPAI